MSKSKVKGTLAESAIVLFLRKWFPYVERLALQGSKDRGDITGIPGVVIEIKNCVKLDLGGWIKEAEQEATNAGVDVYMVWHKKKGTTDPGKWYVTMPGEVAARLLDCWVNDA